MNGPVGVQSMEMGWREDLEMILGFGVARMEREIWEGKKQDWALSQALVSLSERGKRAQPGCVCPPLKSNFHLDCVCHDTLEHFVFLPFTISPPFFQTIFSPNISYSFLFTSPTLQA